MSTNVTATGQGKLIVFGEHAVVYGRPAVACSLPTGARATLQRASRSRWLIEHPNGRIDADADILKAGNLLLEPFGLCADELDIRIEMSIPLGAGLGSSAAMAVAVARGAARLLDLNEADTEQRVSRAVVASESVFHGKASGIDQQAAMGSGFFTFHKSDSGPVAETLEVDAHRWVVARVAPSKSTAAMVQSVADRRERLPGLMESLFDDFALLSELGAQALTEGAWDVVGELMNINQGLLNAIGVSSPILEAACTAANRSGALGAKITGAGGGGCILALAQDDDDRLVDALGEYGDVFEFTLAGRNSTT